MIEDPQLKAKRDALAYAIGDVMLRIAAHRQAPLSNEEQFALRQDVIGLVLSAYTYLEDIPAARSVGVTLLDAYTP